MFSSRGGGKSILSSRSGSERNVVYVLFPGGGDIRKRGRKGNERLHLLASLQFLVLLSALAGLAVPVR